MAINFNNHKSEYELYNNMSGEIIDSYGVFVTYLKTEFMEVDEVLGDIKSYAVTKTEQVIKNIALLPETPAGFENQDNILSNFGLINLDSMDFFMSRSTLDKIYPNGEFNKMAGDLIVLPSNKIMEITNIKTQVPGANNAFVYRNEKNVYQITCKTYAHKGDEITAEIPKPKNYNNESNIENENLETLDELFNTLGEEVKKQQQDEQSPVVKSYDSVFGDLG